MAVRDMFLDFSDVSGGKNSAMPRHAVGQNQCVDTINLIHERLGVTRAPGFKGVTDTQQFDYPMRGFWTFHLDDGTERLIVANNKKLYSVSV
jgi:hypothetical protein